MPAAELPGAPGPADSIIQRLIDAARRPAGVRFVGQSVAPVAGDGFVPWAEIHEEAKGVAVALAANGVVPGDHAAILGPTSRSLMTVIQGCWLAGAASMVLPLPMRMGSLDAFIESTGEGELPATGRRPWCWSTTCSPSSTPRRQRTH